MSEFWMVRHGDALAPANAESAGELARLPHGKRLFVSVRRPRNAEHHALYWVLCTRIANAIGAEPENVSDILKISTGHCSIVKTAKYGEVRLPKSISFAAMDQTAFREFFERCVHVIQAEWGIKRQDVLAAVSDILEPKAVQA